MQTTLFAVPDFKCSINAFWEIAFYIQTYRKASGSPKGSVRGWIQLFNITFNVYAIESKHGANNEFMVLRIDIRVEDKKE